jgi:catechol 2,3-dioxygenase-like lactoylglutathione lyase family enzyme
MTGERPLRVAELDHVVVRCRDQARALDFYTRVLGLAEERRLDAIGLIQLRAGQSMLDLVPADPPPTQEGRNVDHFCLGVEVADMEALVRWLRAEGVEVLGDPMPRYGARGMGLSVYVLDPDGNIVELKQLPAVSSPGRP